MTWYRFHGYAGPGHQSSWEEYVWFEGTPDDEVLEDVGEGVVPDWADDGSNISHQPEVVDQLPAEVRGEKIQDARSWIAHARHTLAVLGASESESG